MNHTVQLIVILLRFHIFLLNILDENVSDDDLLRAHITIVEYCKNENSTSLRSCLWRSVSICDCIFSFLFFLLK